MAIKCGFFDAALDEITGEFDREYDSDSMSIPFNAIAGNGVFKKEQNAFEVLANETMGVSVSSGTAIALGRYIQNTTAYPLTLSAASSSNDRIDTIVLRMSKLQNERDFTIIVKEGTPALAPVAPTPQRNQNVYELQLAAITVPRNASAITQSMIEDTRANKDLCGFVSGMGGGASVTNVKINSSATAYNSDWLTDMEDVAIVPDEESIYCVQTEGKYLHSIFKFDLTTNKYYGIGSYELELTSEEALALWNDSPVIRLQNYPAPLSNSIAYAGRAVSPEWLYFDPTKVRMTGDTAGTNAGVYYTAFEPINGYAWPDGTTDEKLVSWSIVPRVVTIPTLAQTKYNYTGSSVSAIFNGLESECVQITDGSGTNIGTYNCVVRLLNTTNYVWSDGTTQDRVYQYRIVGMQNVVTLSKNSVTLESDSDSDTITVSSTSGGAISVSSSDETIATASVSGNTITIEPGDGVLKGTATITVLVDGGSLYEVGEATISVTKDYGITIVSWADGTDAEIVAMVQAADQGKIDLHDYWEVGDEREIRIDAIAASGTNTYGSWDSMEVHSLQTNKLVLMDANHYTLETPVLNKNGGVRSLCNFVVGLKGVLLESSNYNGGSQFSNAYWWDSSRRRNWCNTAFAGALPQTLVSIFKRFIVSTSDSANNGESVKTSIDLFSLFAEGEIFSTRVNSSQNEFSSVYQLEHFKTAANRRKTIYNGSNGCSYFTRSCVKSGTATCQVVVKDDGTTTEIFGNNIVSSNLLIFGCI
jgi:hypothetical protein